MKKPLMLVVLGSAVAGGVILQRRKRSPAGAVTPRYPEFVPEGFTPELFEVTTDDGLTLRGKRYANRDATPLILLAGFGGNGFNYDIAFERSNFAVYLARKGYDVWVGNFRGTGREPYKSDGGDFSHYIQDLCIHDMPALIRRVTESTGKKPVLMGHSMGGVVCYGYLQGVDYHEEDGKRDLRPDIDLARERNDSVAAVVSLTGPASFYWPKDCWHYWLVASPFSRFFLRGLRAWLIRLARRANQVPIESSVINLINRAPGLAYIVLKAGYSLFANLRNMNREMLFEAWLSGLSDVSIREAYQLVNALLTRDLVGSSAMEGEDGDGQHNFTKSMHLVSAPILFIVGELDIVNASVLYRDGYQQVSSRTKDYNCFKGYGHMDLIQGLEISTTVLPYVTDWLEKVI